MNTQPAIPAHWIVLAWFSFRSIDRSLAFVGQACPVLVDEEAGVLIPTAVRNHFRYLDVLSLW